MLRASPWNFPVSLGRLVAHASFACHLQDAFVACSTSVRQSAPSTICTAQFASLLRPERRRVATIFKPASAKVVYQPLGVVGIVLFRRSRGDPGCHCRRRLRETWGGACDAVAKEGSKPVESVEAMGRAYVEFALRNPAYFQTMFRADAVPLDR
jgi:hypothetical protein